MVKDEVCEDIYISLDTLVNKMLYFGWPTSAKSCSWDPGLVSQALHSRNWVFSPTLCTHFSPGSNSAGGLHIILNEGFFYNSQ